MGKIRILVVDDSLIFRHAVEDSLKLEPDMRVVGSVRNGKKAIEFITTNEVDIVTLDLEMPEMDGLATLDEIQKINSERKGVCQIGVLILTSKSVNGARTTIDALEKGAYDFIAKPQGSSETECIVNLKHDLVPRIRQYVRGGTNLTRKTQVIAGIAAAKAASVEASIDKSKTFRGQARVIVVGVSTGGPRALTEMLPKLCQKTSLPILIVQHMPPAFTLSLAESLGKKCMHKVKEGVDGESIVKQYVYIAPGGRHMMITRNVSGEAALAINDQPPENGCRPSVDILFRSAAAVYGSEVVATILTGMGTDGTLGLRPLKRAGAWIIAQDEASSVVWGMPGSAVETGLVDEIVELDKVPDAIAAAAKQ